MTNYIAGFAVVFGTIYFLKIIGVIKRSKSVFKVALSSIRAIQDDDLTDAEKQTVLQKNAFLLFYYFLLISLGGIIGIAIPIAIIWLLDFTKLLKFEEVFLTLISPLFIIGIIFLSVIYFVITRNKDKDIYSAQYSNIDRLLHRVSFGTIKFQLSISKIESFIYKKPLNQIDNQNPVFISGLPRAGTTILLELIIKSRQYCSHTYRNMPFLLIPLIWNKFSKIFKINSLKQERAHGDGLKINIDSPEAFEEILWKAYWPSRYNKDKILTWLKPKYPNFEKYFEDHMKKIILSYSQYDKSQIRYISKNNLNIARLNYLKQIFPSSILLIPFRSPLQHSASLLKQHKNFLQIHKKDPFSKEYMKDIGHFDFGDNLRPINFNNWITSDDLLLADTLEFWVKYWINTYGYILNNNSTVVTFISFEKLYNNPEDSLRIIDDYISYGSKNINDLQKYSNQIVAPKLYDIENDRVSSDLIEEANRLYSNLMAKSVI